ncbi:MAG: DUF6502 family protein [Candidatus Binatales bacterium]
MKPVYNVKSKVLGAFRHLLVPLVRVLIRNGVGFHEFSQVVKEVYAKVCLREFSAVDGSPQPHSRVAVVTGMTRGEVAQLLSEDSDLRRAFDTASSRVVNLLQGWHTDADFVGPYGVPRDLFLTSDPLGLQTFTELVRRYCSDVTPTEMLDELLKADAVLVPTDREPVRVVKRTYIPESMAPDAVEMFARSVRRFAETADYNLWHESPDERLFERWVFPDDGIRDRDWSAFHALVSERLQDLVRELDTKFSWFESPRNRDEEGMSVGVGIYVYRDTRDDQKDWEQMLGYAPRKN